MPPRPSRVRMRYRPPRRVPGMKRPSSSLTLLTCEISGAGPPARLLEATVSAMDTSTFGSIAFDSNRAPLLPGDLVFFAPIARNLFQRLLSKVVPVPIDMVASHHALKHAERAGAVDR